MSTLGLIEYKDASPEVRAVYDDIMATRKTDWINNFWKAIAHDPATLKRTWEDIKQIMAPGALDPLTKEMIYVAVSVTNQCHYCIASHTVGAKERHDRCHVQRVDGGRRHGQRNQQNGHGISGRDRPAIQKVAVSCCESHPFLLRAPFRSALRRRHGTLFRTLLLNHVGKLVQRFIARRG